MQKRREEKDEEEQFKEDKAERQRMAELLAEREKILSRLDVLYLWIGWGDMYGGEGENTEQVVKKHQN